MTFLPSSNCPSEFVPKLTSLGSANFSEAGLTPAPCSLVLNKLSLWGHLLWDCPAQEEAGSGMKRPCSHCWRMTRNGVAPKESSRSREGSVHLHVAAPGPSPHAWGPHITPQPLRIHVPVNTREHITDTHGRAEPRRHTCVCMCLETAQTRRCMRDSLRPGPERPQRQKGKRHWPENCGSK